MTSPVLIAPSILSADFARLGEEVARVDEAGADRIHLDVMDGHFVPNLTMGPALVKALRPYTARPFDVHLMVAPVDPFLAAFADAGADSITVHIEAGPHLHRTLGAVRVLGVGVGVAINPATPVEMLDPVLDLVDIVLVMTVNPGFGGQRFIESSLPKIAAIRSRVAGSGRDIRIGVDGGIDSATAPRAIAAGADLLIAGTSVYGQGAANYRHAIAALRPPA